MDKKLSYNELAGTEEAEDRLVAEKGTAGGEAVVSLVGAGCRAWSEMYELLVGRLVIELVMDGQAVQLPLDRATDLLVGEHGETREAVANAWELRWGKEAELFAHVFNQLGELRLAHFRQRGWDSVLTGALADNRVSLQTFEAMMQAISIGQQQFLPFWQRKAQLLGKPRLDWHEAFAPLHSKPSRENGNRTAKRDAGKLSNFCLLKAISQFRHFQHGLPRAAKQGLAYLHETAASLAEMVALERMMHQASTREEKLAVLEAKVHRAAVFLVECQANFWFERRYYQRRMKGKVDAHELSDLMVRAQREAYGDGLQSYHPHEWAARRVFFQDTVAFYAIPETLGFLFASWLYRSASRQGRALGSALASLVRDAAGMSVETLGAKHFAVDLRQPESWLEEIGRILDEINEYVALLTE